MATNAFADHTHAMLLGGLYLDDAVYEAQCLAATGRDARQGVLPNSFESGRWASNFTTFSRLPVASE